MSLGGKREGAGAKKKEDKKEPLTIYVEPSKILGVGGKEVAKELCYKAIDKEAKKRT
jgi:hypothetical protein